MVCMFSALAVVVVLLSAVAILIWRRKVTAKWWALPVLGLGLILTFVVPVLFFPLVARLDPALWLVDALRDWGLYLTASWIVALIILLVFKGFAFSSPRWKVASLVVLALVMLPSSFVGCVECVVGPEQVLFSGPGESSVSPDGRWRAYCHHFFWLEVTVSLWYEHNEWFNVQGRESDCVDLSHMGGRLDPSWRVVWSRDSAIASIWRGDVALLACDVNTGTSWCVPLEHDEAERLKSEELRTKMTAFTDQVQSILESHGGAAP